MAEVLEAVGMLPMKEYIWSRQDTIVEYIANFPIYELCTKEERMPVSCRLMRWWDQDINQ